MKIPADHIQIGCFLTHLCKLSQLWKNKDYLWWLWPWSPWRPWSVQTRM